MNVSADDHIQIIRSVTLLNKVETVLNEVRAEMKAAYGGRGVVQKFDILPQSGGYLIHVIVTAPET